MPALERIILLDPDPLVRRAVSALLEAHGTPVHAGYAGVQEAITAVPAQGACLLVCEILTDGTPVRTLVREVLTVNPWARFVVLTGETDAAILAETVHPSVGGILSKYEDTGLLAERILLAARPGMVLDGITRDALLPKAGRDRPVALTGREREVLTLLHQGLSMHAIARRSGLSESTVKSHAAKAAARFGVRSSRTAAELAHRADLLEQLQ